MDLSQSNPGWYARLTVTGNSREFRFEGSYLGIIRSITQTLAELNPRVLADGAKGINIDLSTLPITSARVEELRKATEVESLLDPQLATQAPTPLPGEDMLAMASRLVNEGESSESAMFWARDAFGYGPDPEVVKRQSDPRVVAFLRLNASDRAAEAADPQEFESLKHYIRDTYPVYFATLRPRK